jgi:hypothetical protein
MKYLHYTYRLGLIIFIGKLTFLKEIDHHLFAATVILALTALIFEITKHTHGKNN